MKKIISITAALILTALLGACGSSYSASTAAETPVAIASTPTPEPTRTPAPQDGYKDDGKLYVYIRGQGKKLETPNSAFIEYIIYYPETEHMIITTKDGDEQVYANVNENIFGGFRVTWDADSYYYEGIADHSQYLLNGYIPGKEDDIVIEYEDTSIKIVGVYPYIPSPSLSTATASGSHSGISGSSDSTDAGTANLIRCNDCGRQYPKKDMIYLDAYRVYICSSCLNSGDYYECDACGEIFHIDDMYGDDELYCEDCWEEIGDDWW